MEILRFFESIRNPVLDGFFSLVTHLGEETPFILLGIIFYWCISKKNGYFIFLVGFMGTLFNQFLKLLCRVPRPWVLDKNFTIVESARAEATGYSFPSGHTQSAVGSFGAIARMYKNIWVRIICISICILVPISRMYLGVHTPLDVGVAFLMAAIMILVLYPFLNYMYEKKNGMRVIFISMIGIAVAYLLFVLLYPFPADIDPHNFLSGTKNAYKILGCSLGLWMSYEIDNRFLHFETKSAWWVHILKIALGLIPILAVKEGLRAPLDAIFGGHLMADCIRYFLLTLVAGGIWPMTFKYFNRLSKKSK